MIKSKKNGDKNVLEFKTLYICVTREPNELHFDRMNSSMFSGHIKIIKVDKLLICGTYFFALHTAYYRILFKTLKKNLVIQSSTFYIRKQWSCGFLTNNSHQY